MDIGAFTAEAMHHLPLPVLALEPVGAEGSAQGDLRVVWANPAAAQRFGPDVEGAWLDRDQPLGAMASIVPAAERCRRLGQRRVVQRAVQDDDHARHLRCTILPAEVGAALITEDVTVAVEASAELAVVSSALERVERWGNLGVWEVDLRASTIYWSTQVYEILGVEDQCLQRFQQVIHPDDRALVDHVTQRLLVQPGPYRVEHRIIRDGEVRTLDQHMQSVPDASGRPVRLLGTMIDVTAARALQQQVHQGQQMRTIGLLAGGMAHDLANALFVMRGHADLLLTRSDLDDEVRDSLTAITRGGEKATTLTRRFMALGRHDELRPERVDPALVAEAVLDLVRPTVRSELTVAVERTHPASSSYVLADEARLRQVLLDLVFNARDAGATTVTIEIGEELVRSGDPRCVEHGLLPGRYGVIAVVDDGAGIDAQTLAHVFDPFFTTKAEDAGSGLGLANAQDFARQSVGAIVPTSAPGAGTTMSLLLPAAVADRSRARRRPARRVLVGASPDRCDELAGALAAADAQVVCMEDLDGFTYSLETEPIDVAVIDESLLASTTWPRGLGDVPTILVAADGTHHPEADLQVRTGDTARLLAALEDLWPARGRR
jgi:PAS domain S-box-containing protein